MTTKIVVSYNDSMIAPRVSVLNTEFKDTESIEMVWEIMVSEIWSGNISAVAMIEDGIVTEVFPEGTKWGVVKAMLDATHEW